MTTMTSITTHAGASVHTERYEALRSRALDPHHAVAAHEGLVVLLRQGVALWMQACSTLPTCTTPTTPQRCDRAVLADAASAEVVRILAAMALRHLQEMHS